MYKIDEKSKRVTITDEGFITSASYAFSEIDDLEKINKSLYSEIKEKVDQIELSLLSKEKLDAKKIADFVARIKQNISEGKSTVKVAYEIGINYRDDTGNRYASPSFVAIKVIEPENLYMSVWDDWSSGWRNCWELDKTPDKLLEAAKSYASESTQVKITDASTGKIIFFHRGDKY